jgi:peptide/nickel transport system permease protein
VSVSAERLQALGPAAGAVETPFRRFAAQFCESRIALAALAMLGLLVLAALAASWLAPQNPYDLAKVTVLDARLAPGERGSAGFGSAATAPAATC